MRTAVRAPRAASLVLSLSVAAVLVACGAAKSSDPAVGNVLVPPAMDAGAPSDAAATASLAPAANDFDRYAAIPVNANDPVQGATPALVTVVEYGDFQCPFTQKVQATIAQLQQEYGPDQLRIIWKNEPLAFHAYARRAAEAGMGVYALAGNDAFWAFQKLAFDNQPQLSDATIRTWAVAAGVQDVSALNAGLAAHTWSKKVDDDDATFHAAGGQGTPTFFVNGLKVSGAEGHDAFKAMIDKELLAAEALLANGTAKEQIYVQRTNVNAKANANAKAAASAPAKEDTKTVNRIAIGASPTLGPAAAPVTVVEFGSFACTYCKHAEETLKKLRVEYGDKIRLVWKDLPLAMYNRAEPAAEIAREAWAEKGLAGFWDMHDRLFVAQPKLEDADLAAVAADAGLDVRKVAAVLKDLPYKHTIVLDSEEADSFAASGTPTFFLNGRRLVGDQPIAKFRAIIDEEIAHVNQLEATGVKPAAAYDAIMKTAKDATPLELKVLPTAARAPSKGTGPVVIQEIADFQSPFVAREEPILEELLKAYPGKVKLVWRNLPLAMHADAELAAEAAMEAFAQKGATGFWKMHDAILAAQTTTDGIKRPALDAMASAEGLDAAKFTNALDGKTHAVAIAEDQAAASAAGIVGVPAFVINGYFVNGALPYAKLDRAVRAALDDRKTHGAPAPATHGAQ